MPPIVKDVTIKFHQDTTELKTTDALLDSTNKKIATQESLTKSNAQASKQASAEIGSSWAKLESQLLNIGKLVIAAFAIERVVQFGAESVKAYREAEVNLQKLKFAVTEFGKAGADALDKLLEQSSKLQDISIFSDDDIQKSQTMLLTLGLTVDQTEKLIPQVLDLASATGTDLATATDKVINGINGQTRGLKDVGIQFEDTGSKTKNLALLTDQLNKFQGASADALNTSAGAAKNLENRIGDVQEKIGGFIEEWKKGWKVAFTDIYETLTGTGGPISAIVQNAIVNSTNTQVDELRKQFDNLKIANSEKLKLVADAINTENQLLINTTDAGQREYIKIRKAGLQTLYNELLKSGSANTKIVNDLTLKGESDLANALAKQKQKRLEEEKMWRDAMLDIDATLVQSKKQAAKDFADSLGLMNTAELQFLLDTFQINDVMMQEQLDKRQEFINEAEQLELERHKEFLAAKQEADQMYMQAQDELLNTQVAFLSKGAEILQSFFKEGSVAAQAFFVFSKLAAAGNILIQLQQEKAGNTLIATEKGIINPALAETYLAIALVKNQAANARAILSLGVIAAQAVPVLKGFKDGVIDLEGPGTETSDSIFARLSRRESVMTADETKKYKGELLAMRNENFEKYVNEKYVLPQLQMFMARHYSDDQLQVEATIDEQTLAKYLRGSGEVTVKNMSAIEKYLASQARKERMFKRNHV